VWVDEIEHQAALGRALADAQGLTVAQDDHLAALQQAVDLRFDPGACELAFAAWLARRGARENYALPEERAEAMRHRMQRLLARSIWAGAAAGIVAATLIGGQSLATRQAHALLERNIDTVRAAVAFERGLGFEQVKQLDGLLGGLFRLFNAKDASIAEINPLVITQSGDLVALDAKINFDDNALYRHSEIAELRDPEEEDARERAAKEIDLAYVGLDGNIGCMVNGAGLAMATLDMIQYCGGSPANFLDAGGGADKEKVKEAFKLILNDENVKAILVNIFGGIVRCDLIAEGVVAAAAELGVEVPLVVRLQGTMSEEGRAILAESDLNITPAETLKEAGEKAVAAAAGAA